jgi:hypothetical protein
MARQIAIRSLDDAQRLLLRTFEDVALGKITSAQSNAIVRQIGAIVDRKMKAAATMDEDDRRNWLKAKRCPPRRN